DFKSLFVLFVSLWSISLWISWKPVLQTPSAGLLGGFIGFYLICRLLPDHPLHHAEFPFLFRSQAVLAGRHWRNRNLYLWGRRLCGPKLLFLSLLGQERPGLFYSRFW